MKKISILLLCSFLLVSCDLFNSKEKTKSEPEVVVPVQECTTLVMYYGAADNDLEIDLYADLNEMESVNMSGTGIKTVALFDRWDNNEGFSGDGNWTDTRAFELGYDPTGYNLTLSSNTKRIAIPSLGITETGTKELRLDEADVLSKFIDFCYKNYTADNYILIMSNHGGGWRGQEKERRDYKAICWDYTSGEDNALYMEDVKNAIKTGAGGKKVDMIAFDACLMGMVEVAYELRDVSSYLVASSELVPGAGYAYTQIYTNLRNNPNISITDIGRIIVDEYIDAYQNGEIVEDLGYVETTVTLALYDLSKINTLVSAIDDMGSTLSNNYINIDGRISSLSMNEVHNVDLGDYVKNDPQVSGHKTAILNAIDNLVIHNGKPSQGVYSDSTGVALFFPVNYMDYNYDYNSQNIEFASAAPNWAGFIEDSNPTESNLDIAELNFEFALDSTNLPYTGYSWTLNDMDMFTLDSSFAGQTLKLSFPNKEADYDLYVCAFDDNYNTLWDDYLGYGAGMDEEIYLDVVGATSYFIVVSPFGINPGDTYSLEIFR